MRAKSILRPISILLVTVLFSVLATQPSSAQNMIASFGNMSDQNFDVRAIAPRDVLAEYALCKAIWFAEQNQAETIWLGDPAFSAPQDSDNTFTTIPKDWLVLSATAYFAEQDSGDFPSFDVAENAAACREAWDWYRG